MNHAKKNKVNNRYYDLATDSLGRQNPNSLEFDYEKPLLFTYGDVRDVTLGGSPGGGDSGTPTTRRRR